MRVRLPALILSLFIAAGLSSCALFAPLYEVDGQEYTCLLYGSDSVSRIKVISDEETIATFKTDGAVINSSDYGFKLIDANFDGYKDMCLITSTGTLGTKYSFWIYNPTSETFGVDKILNTLLSPTFDYSEKTITAPYKKHIIDPAVGTDPETYIDEEGTITYEWRQGALTAIKKECITFYSESEIYCVAVWDINTDGELEPTVERWLMPDQYARAGYEPIG